MTGGPSPVEAAFGGMTPETARADDDDNVFRLPVRESRLQTLLLIVVGAVSLTAAGIAVWYKMSGPAESDRVAGGARYKNVNLAFQPPPSPWVPDGESRALLDAPFFEVFKRENPEAHMAFGARDFEDHEPRPGELDDVLVRALGRIVDPNSLKRFSEGIPTTWMVLGVTGFKFSGLTANAGTIEGEALAASYKGIGYWFISWTGSTEMYLEMKPAFEVGRSGCSLLGDREDWKPTIPQIVEYINNELGYTILDSEHVWNQIEDEDLAKGQDPFADKYLAIFADPKKRNKEYKAQLIVAILNDTRGQPLEDARAHVESRMNEDAELAGKYVFTEHKDRLEGEPTHPAEENAEVLLLKAVNEKNSAYSWLFAVSAIRVKDKTVVLYAWCPFRERSLYDTKLVQIAKSLRADATDD